MNLQTLSFASLSDINKHVSGFKSYVQLTLKITNYWDLREVGKFYYSFSARKNFSCTFLTNEPHNC